MKIKERIKRILQDTVRQSGLSFFVACMSLIVIGLRSSSQGNAEQVTIDPLASWNDGVANSGSSAR